LRGRPRFEALVAERVSGGAVVAMISQR